MRQVHLSFVTMMLAVSCVSTSSPSRIDRFNVGVGDEFVLVQEASVYKCRLWENTWSIWFRGPPETLCLKSSGDLRDDDVVVDVVEAGTKLRVERIKVIDVGDAIYYLIYVKATDWPDAIIVYLTWFDLENLLNSS